MVKKLALAVLTIVQLIVLWFFDFRLRGTVIYSRPGLIFALFVILGLALLISLAFSGVLFAVSLVFFTAGLAYSLYLYSTYGGLTLSALMAVSALGVIFTISGIQRKRRVHLKKAKENSGPASAKNEEPKIIIEKMPPKKANFVASTIRKYYHVPKCFAARRISKETKVTFETEGEARAKKYLPHKCVKK